MSFDEIFDLTAGVYFNFYNSIAVARESRRKIHASVANLYELVVRGHFRPTQEGSLCFRAGKIRHSHSLKIYTAVLVPATRATIEVHYFFSEVLHFRSF